MTSFQRLPFLFVTAVARLRRLRRRVEDGPEKAKDGLNKVLSLHRGELSAVSTYDQALAKVEKESFKSDLQKLRDDHRDAADKLADRVKALGGTPDTAGGRVGRLDEADHRRRGRDQHRGHASGPEDRQTTASRSTRRRSRTRTWTPTRRRSSATASRRVSASTSRRWRT